MEQRSAEWIAARVGSIGASRVHEIVAKGRGDGFSSSRASYMEELIAERLTGQPADKYVSQAMEWGSAREAEARSLYSFIRDVDVEEVGLILHPSIKGSHASPDGLIGADRFVEFKAPNSATHLSTIMRGTVPDKYITQMHWVAACSKRQLGDFVSYDPRVEPKLRMFIMSVEIDNARVARLESAVREFIGEMETKIEWLLRENAA